VVLPAFNEARALQAVICSIETALAECQVDMEVLVVDDGSTDHTRATLRELAAQDPALRYLRLSRNFGKEAALSAGLQHARGDAVILMDSDGQHPTALIPEFLARWRAGAQSVGAVQTVRNEPASRRWAKRWFYQLIQAGSHVDIRPGAGDFRLMDRVVVDQLNALPERNRFMKGLYAWVGFDTEWVEFEAAPRLDGHTRFGWRKLLHLGITGLTSFSVTPLRLVSSAGLMVSFAALGYGAYLIYDHWQGHQLPGWATLTVGMMLLSGVQLLAIGVIGEYLGRVFEEVKQRPLYVIAEDSAGEAAQGHARLPQEAMPPRAVPL